MNARTLAASMMVGGVLVAGVPMLAGPHAVRGHALTESLRVTRVARTRTTANTYHMSRPAPRLHVVGAMEVLRTTTVRPGEGLAQVAQRLWGDSSLWPDLWWANHKQRPNPSYTVIGEKLIVPAYHGPPGWRLKRALAAMPKPAPSPVSTGGGTPSPPPPSAGIYSFSALERLWVSAGGPASVESSAASIAECESGGNPRAWNPSGASGLWQILGQVVAGNIFDPFVNALNAVKKYRDAGNSFSPWVCQATQAASAKLLASVHHAIPKRLRAFRWAIAHIKGCWYRWGGNGPCSIGWDCSGAVHAAYAAVGINLPRIAADIQRSWWLVRIPASQARKGDIVAWGFPAFHVELVAYKWKWTFGEHSGGTRASTVRTWDAPHAFYRVRHAG